MLTAPIKIGVDNHIHLIWQMKGGHKSSEIQKRFLERISKEIKNDLQLNHSKVFILYALPLLVLSPKFFLFADQQGEKFWVLIVLMIG